MTVLQTRESGRDRMVRCIDAFLLLPQGSDIDAYDATGEQGTEDGFSFKIAGEHHIFTFTEAEAFRDMLADWVRDDVVAGRNVGLSQLLEVVNQMIWRAHRRKR